MDTGQGTFAKFETRNAADAHAAQLAELQEKGVTLRRQPSVFSVGEKVEVKKLKAILLQITKN